MSQQQKYDNKGLFDLTDSFRTTAQYGNHVHLS